MAYKRSSSHKICKKENIIFIKTLTILHNRLNCILKIYDYLYIFNKNLNSKRRFLMQYISYEEKLAKLITHHSLNLKKGDVVQIKAETSAEPLVKAMYKEIIKLGAYPFLRLFIPESQEYMAKYASQEQLTYLPEFDIKQAEIMTAYIYIDSTINTKSLTNADHSKIALMRKTALPVREIMNKRELEGKFRWSLCPYPNQSMAQDAEMSLDEYTAFVYEACKLNEDDPIAAWKKVEAEQEAIANRMNGTKWLHIKGKDTDLKLKVEGRKWENCCGYRNMPDGEVFTSPVEDSAEGTILFDIPTTYNGVEAKNVFLRFEKGKVVEARAEKGQDFLHKMLDMDDGSRFAGEIAFGLNDNIQIPTKNILFDEKIGKSMHLAIGASYQEVGGKNVSALHWDLIKDMKNGGTVEADGVLVYKDGKHIL